MLVVGAPSLQLWSLEAKDEAATCAFGQGTEHGSYLASPAPSSSILRLPTHTHTPRIRPQRSTFIHTFSHEVNLRLLTGCLFFTMLVTLVLNIRALDAVYLAHYVVQILPFLALSSRWNSVFPQSQDKDKTTSKSWNSLICPLTHQNRVFGTSSLPPV